MSSMRNAVQRRNHKERAQPLQREKWGILEKHKDYSLRAKDHKEKRRRIKALKEKAAFRNPDEFHFGMMSSGARNGTKIGDRGNEALSNEVVQLLKTQDAGYVRTMLQKTRKERERLEEEIQIFEGEGKVVALKGDAVGRGKVAFVQSREEQEKFLSEEDDEREDDEEEQDNVPSQTSRKLLDSAKDVFCEERRIKKKRQKDREVRRHLLEAVKEREEQLVLADRELEIQRAKMSNSIGGVNKNGVKFKVRERKR